MTHPIFYKIARKYPDLQIKLNQADLYFEPQEYIKKIFLAAAYTSASISLALFLMFAGNPKLLGLIIILVPAIFVVVFMYLMKLPDAKLQRKAKEIDKEIVFAGKFMIIEINSGISLYQVMKNIAENYGGIGEYFRKILADIDLGTEMQEAINNAILNNPSDNFRKVMWQLSNSLKTGADITLSLNTVLSQINKNQMIEVEKYGKKLNPIATFYLMLAVIIPSLGMVMVVVFASFINLKLPLWAFLFIAVLLTIFQFMFYAIIKINRPAVEM